MSIDYDKFKKVFEDEHERQKIDTLLNVSGLEVISTGIYVKDEISGVL